MSEYTRWENRYAGTGYAFGEQPNYFLASCKPLLPRSGRALAVADGEGRNGVWLAQQGLDVLSIDFSPSALTKARALALERNVHVVFQQVDVHHWEYPEAAFDVVVEIFSQFSSPPERAIKWAGMRRTLKPAGLLIIHGYTPKQLEYGTGGPKQLENLYTRAMLEDGFREFRDIRIVEEERDIQEGTSHAGISAVINFTARKPTAQEQQRDAAAGLSGQRNPGGQQRRSLRMPLAEGSAPPVRRQPRQPRGGQARQ